MQRTVFDDFCNLLRDVVNSAKVKKWVFSRFMPDLCKANRGTVESDNKDEGI